MTKNYYQILEIDKNANLTEIKKAYYKSALKWHPREEGGDKKQFQEINDAYEILSNPEIREKYDEQLNNSPDSSVPTNDFSVEDEINAIDELCKEKGIKSDKLADYFDLFNKEKYKNWEKEIRNCSNNISAYSFVYQLKEHIKKAKEREDFIREKLVCLEWEENKNLLSEEEIEIIKSEMRKQPYFSEESETDEELKILEKELREAYREVGKEWLEFTEVSTNYIIQQLVKNLFHNPTYKKNDWQTHFIIFMLVNKAQEKLGVSYSLSEERIRGGGIKKWHAEHPEDEKDPKWQDPLSKGELELAKLFDKKYGKKENWCLRFGEVYRFLHFVRIAKSINQGWRSRPLDDPNNDWTGSDGIDRIRTSISDLSAPHDTNNALYICAFQIAYELNPSSALGGGWEILNSGFNNSNVATNILNRYKHLIAINKEQKKAIERIKLFQSSRGDDWILRILKKPTYSNDPSLTSWKDYLTAREVDIDELKRRENVINNVCKFLDNISLARSRIKKTRNENGFKDKDDEIKQQLVADGLITGDNATDENYSWLSHLILSVEKQEDLDYWEHCVNAALRKLILKSAQIKITTYETIIKNELGFDPSTSDLTTQIKNKLGGVKLKAIPVSLKELVNNYNNNKDLQSQLDKAQTEVQEKQAQLDRVFCPSEANHQARNKDLQTQLEKNKEKELLTTIASELKLGFANGQYELKQVLDKIKSLIINKSPDTSENKKKIEQLEREIAELKNRDNLLDKSTILAQNKILFRDLGINISVAKQQEIAVSSAAQVEKTRNGLIKNKFQELSNEKNGAEKLNIILGMLTLGSLLTLAYLIIKKTNSPTAKTKSKPKN